LNEKKATQIMTRSRIFLGFAACLLGFGGFAANKLAKFNSIIAKYKPTPSSCMVYGFVVATTAAFNPLYTVSLSGKHYQLYTAFTDNCVVKLRRGGL
jgi:hypothetical protein